MTISNALINQTQRLTLALDGHKIGPLAVMIVQAGDTRKCAIWMVPPSALDPKAYKKSVAQLIALNTLHEIDPGCIHYLNRDNDVLRTTARLVRCVGINNVVIENHFIDGAMIPDGVIIRLNI